jgi:FHA domain-containing protein
MASLHDQQATLVLWIDGVGGYLVCLSHRVTLGQALTDTPVDIALIADVSRHHATIQRDPEGYFLEAPRKVQINGQQAEKALLRSGDRITLGNSCQLQFWQPVAVSTSARLDMVSGHRFAEPVQGVILMADTLVIGPQTQAHVQAPDMTDSLILYRKKNGLAARWPGVLTINGTKYQERGPLDPGSTLVTDQISLALERVGKGR